MKEAFDNSRFMSKMLEKGIVGKTILYIVTHLPQWLYTMDSEAPVMSSSEQIARAIFEKQQ
ncbi:hypothetical protein BG015_003026 [Linnemannia schmuckeri]|uniref:Uncharacterized protein n=1 Tax=Linnemannia schmuckeri TaxID=64567 RepID=A0A9P5RQJ3_9FUNG|nr:hypothetical protein BG015_003026 [Linnemannia schmuckeri]